MMPAGWVELQVRPEPETALLYNSHYHQQQTIHQSHPPHPTDAASEAHPSPHR